MCLSVGRSLTESGEYLKSVGTPVMIDSKNDLWTFGSNGVVEYNEKEEELKHFGSEGSGSGQFKGPRGIAIGPEGSIWVTDEGNDRVEEFNEKGEYAGQFGSRGRGKEQFGGTEGGSPMAITTDAKGNVYVTDNEWVEKWTNTSSPETTQHPRYLLYGRSERGIPELR